MFRIYFTGELGYEMDGYIEVRAETLGEVETIALLECRRRINSRYIMLHHVRDLVYDILEGSYKIGTVKIRSL